MSNVAILPQNLTGSFSFQTNADWRDPPILFQTTQGQTVDLTGISFKMTIKPSPSSPQVILGLSTAPGGYMINGGAAGTLAIVVPVSVTQRLPPGSYVADIVAEGVDASGNSMTMNLFETPATVTIAQGITTP